VRLASIGLTAWLNSTYAHPKSFYFADVLAYRVPVQAGTEKVLLIRLRLFCSGSPLPLQGGITNHRRINNSMASSLLEPRRSRLRALTVKKPLSFRTHVRNFNLTGVANA
jgi:hypothetical protein